MTRQLITINKRYELRGKLGQGGMGEVFQARDRLTQEIVALKRVLVAPESLNHNTMSSQEDMRVSLAREFQTLASVRHPHIIKVLDYGFDLAGQPYFTMTLLDDPQDILEASKDRSFTDKIALLIQLFQALTYLHRRKIIHRDLKPANILVDQSGLHVLDFGLAMNYTEQGEIAGTLSYLAPEILRGLPASMASDLYATGVIAYQMFTGHHPFQSISATQMLQAIMDKDPDLSILPDEQIKDIIDKLLAKKPQDRYKNANQVIKELNRLVGNQPLSESESIRESFLQAAEFVGRQDELKRLTNALQNILLQQPQGSSWLIGGESGVGKSRLMDELRIRAAVEGALILTGQEVSNDGQPYQLWRDVLQRLILQTEIDALEASILKQIVPNIGQLIHYNVPDAPPLESKESQKRLILAMGNLFRRASQFQPIVLILDDLQWAEDSLEPLRQLARLTGESRLLIVGSYRDDERPQLEDELTSMNLIRLKRLTRKEITALSQSMLGQPGTRKNIVNLLEQETEGNVFFLVEVVRALAEEAGQLEDITRVTLPATVFAGGVQHIVQRRLQRVPQQYYALLKLAAVIGRQINMGIMQYAVDDFNILDEWLHVCELAIVIEIRDGRWRFVHDKLREFILSDLTEDELKQLHQQTAEAIEKAHPNDISYAAVLAAHWNQAHHAEKAVQYGILAAQQAIEMSTPREAQRWSLTTLSYLQQAQTEGKARILSILGRASFMMGKPDEAKHYLKEALDLGRKFKNTDDLIYILLELGNLKTHLGELELATQYLQESAFLAEAHQNDFGLAKSYHRQGICAAFSGNYNLAEGMFIRALNGYEKINHQAGISACKSNLGVIAGIRGDVQTAQEHIKTALQIARDVGSPLEIAQNLDNLGSLSIDIGEFAAAKDYIQEAIIILHESNLMVDLSLALTNLAWLDIKLELYATAQTYLKEALSIGREVKQLNYLIYTVFIYAELCLKIGLLERSAELCGLVEQYPTIGDGDNDLKDLHNELETRLGKEKFEAARQRGQSYDLDETVAALLQAAIV